VRLATFPTLAGLGWSVDRQEIWQTRKQQNVSGKETLVADWSLPRHQWDLTYEFLRQGSIAGVSYTEMAQLEGFFNLRSGMNEAFVYRDADDNSVTGQLLGSGDGATRAFPLVRTFGGAVEPIGAVVSAPSVYKTDWQGAQLQYTTARTNYITNNTNVGVASGTPGTMPAGWQQTIPPAAGLTAQILGSGVSNGFYYFDWRLSGTASSTAGDLIVFNPGSPGFATAAAPGESWTESVYLARIAGGNTGINQIRLFLAPELSDGSGIGNIQGASVRDDLIATPQRFTVTGVMPSGTALLTSGFRVDVQSGAAIDITLRIGAPQMERNAAATSVIDTSGAARTVTDYALTAGSTGQDTVVNFSTAPAVGATISADIAYGYVVRFLEDSLTFSKFMSTLYEAEKVSLISVK